MFIDPPGDQQEAYERGCEQVKLCEECVAKIHDDICLAEGVYERQTQLIERIQGSLERVTVQVRLLLAALKMRSKPDGHETKDAWEGPAADCGGGG